MKRYLVFAFSNYYPLGGWADFVGESDDRDESLSILDKSLNENDNDEEHIIDLLTGKQVYRKNENYSSGWEDEGILND